MTGRAIEVIAVVATVAMLMTSALWLRSARAAAEFRSQLATSTLTAISSLLKDDQVLIRELHAEPLTEKYTGIINSYLFEIRRDGAPMHADMKRRLDQLAENNTAIVTLIKTYSSQAKTLAFTTEADKFRNYASAWRDRWNSVMEIFMAGGSYSASGVQFPKGFPEAVQAEIAAAM